jgi:multicomponent Na+:H+ antiporter subunit A
VGPVLSTPRAPREAPFALWLGPAVLAVLGVALGLSPEAFIGPILVAAVGATRGEVVSLDLGVKDGPWTVMALSAATLAVGALLYAGRRRLRTLRFGGAGGAFSRVGYEGVMTGVGLLARGSTRLLQSGYLRRYLLVVFLTTVALAGFALLRDGWSSAGLALGPARPHEVAVAVLILVAALVAVRSHSRLAAVAALGVVGFGVALVYALFGAPDLAMTQVLVDSLTVILFVLVIYHLPRFATLSTAAARRRDALVAVLSGALITSLILAAGGAAREPRVGEFYVRESVPRGHGRNVVNVILVDFRGLDTLGEITVLSVAGLGVLALLRLRVRPAEGA